MKDFIALDFETAMGKRSSMCSVGLVVVKDNQIVERFRKLIQPPGNEYHFMNTKVHHITPEMTKDAPRFPEFYPTLKKYLQGNTVVCHNAKFDLDVLAKTMDYYDINDSDLHFSYSCTYEIYGMGLDKCCEKYHIPLKHHDPLSDAEAAAKLFILHNSGESCLPLDQDETSLERDNQKSDNQSICGSVPKADLGKNVNKASPFYNKKVAISGTYTTWPDRKKLAELLKNLGADVDTTVTDKTNILIAGQGVGYSQIVLMLKNIELGKNAAILSEPFFRDLLNLN